jgi:quercetin dioxygenase-like cupin family protein
VSNDSKGLVYVAPGEGEVVPGATSSTIYKITGGVTNGAYSVVESTIEPGILQPPHEHSREDHLFIVTAGEIGVRVGETDLVAVPGSYVFMPRKIPHAFWNAGSVTGKMIQINEPSNFEDFFRDFYVLTATGAPDPKKLMSLMDDYGITFMPQWIPELEAKYGVRGH